MNPSVLHRNHLRVPLLIGLLLLTGADVHAAALHCRVVDVVSGDTLSVQCGEGKADVRLEGLEGPRQQALFWDRARRDLSELVLNQPVDVSVSASEGATLVGHVYLGTTHVNAKLVSDGMAECGASDNTWCAPLEAKARAGLRGIWSDPWQSVVADASPVYVPKPEPARTTAKASTVPPRKAKPLKL